MKTDETFIMAKEPKRSNIRPFVSINICIPYVQFFDFSRQIANNNTHSIEVKSNSHKTLLSFTNNHILRVLVHLYDVRNQYICVYMVLNSFHRSKRRLLLLLLLALLLFLVVIGCRLAYVLQLFLFFFRFYCSVLFLLLCEFSFYSHSKCTMHNTMAFLPTNFYTHIQYYLYYYTVSLISV